jgi:aminotransferase in exopolysaccharide biosynthesis
VTKANALPEQILNAIRTAIGPNTAALHEPTFHGNEWRYLKACLDSTFVSSVGKFVDQFEDELANFTGAKHVVAVVNGTAALHIALKLAGVESNDEVLIPALTFIATANAVTYCNAVPHFIDCDERTLGVDATRLREYLRDYTEQRSGLCVNKSTGRVVRALLPMHTFGHPADLEGLLSLSRDFNVVLVEDAAESLGSYYDGKHTGTFGLIGTLSFNGNKTITTGGGGAILTNDTILARRAKHLTTTAKLPHAWEYRHDEIGYNYRMPNLNAALGCAQLEQLSRLLDAKRLLFDRYETAFAGIDGVSIVKEPSRCKSNYWLQTLVLSRNQTEQRDQILQVTNAAGFMTRPVWTLMHELSMFEDCPRMDLRISSLLARMLINIPSSPHLINFGYE